MSAKQQAAEAFINFTSRPDNVIRNMNYVGYTSVIAAVMTHGFLNMQTGVTAPRMMRRM